MNKWFAVLVVCAMALVAPAVFAADEMIDNPVYQSWAKFKTGTMTKYKQDMEMAGNKTESEITYTLVELTPEKAIVEMEVVSIMMGNKTAMPKTKMEHLAKTAKADPAAAAAAGQVPDASVKQAEEEVEAAGAKMKCKVVESTIKQGDMEAVTKIYQSDEVPGSLVKSVSTMEKPMKTVTTLVLVEKKIP